MSLSSLYLDAFGEVARLRSFSKAAEKLHITQSALSQRVLNLENEIGSSLFIRESSGIRLTDLGQRLLRYCQSKNSLEMEFMESLRAGESEKLHGVICVTGFSTVNRSVVMPLFADLIKHNPQVSLQVRTEEIRNIAGKLYSGATDLALTIEPIRKQEVENHQVGIEENVMIQSTRPTGRHDVYLDHDEDDFTTQDFFKFQGRKVPELKRNYMGDIYSIIDGVKLGMGRAVVPMHLIKDAKGVEVVKGYSPLLVPIYLCYYTQAYYTQLQKAAIALLQSRFAERL